MKTLATAAALTLLVGGTAMAQDAPETYKESYPDYAIGPAMDLLGALEGEQAAIDGKTMQLVQLAVAAQIPCTYCIYYHTRAARLRAPARPKSGRGAAAADTLAGCGAAVLERQRLRHGRVQGRGRPSDPAQLIEARRRT